MKTAIYIEDGITQLVITPESEFEKDALKTLREKRIEAKLFEGSFYDCRGGWVRQSAHMTRGMYDSYHDSRDSSLILVARERPPDTIPAVLDDAQPVPSNGGGNG